MKICIVSDSHGRAEPLAAAVAKAQAAGAQTVIHCGDLIGANTLRASIKQGNRNVRVMTMTEVMGIATKRGDYTATLKISPRYVNSNCTACGNCAAVVE